MWTQNSSSSVVVDQSWTSYYQANRSYAVELLQAIKASFEADAEKEHQVWIHDTEMMLVPSILRSMLDANHYYRQAKVKIGFALHTPFPPSEDFRALPKFIRQELVEGLMCADVVQFRDQSCLVHFVENVRKLFNSAAIDGLRKVQYDHHTVELSVDSNEEAIREPSHGSLH